MRTFRILILCVIFCAKTYSQQSLIDSLTLKVSDHQSQNDQQYLDYLFELSLKRLENYYPESNLKAQQLFQLSEKMEYQEGLINSMLLSGLVALRNNQFVKAKSHLRKAIKKAKHLDQYPKEARIYAELTGLYSKIETTDSVHYYYQKTLETSKKLNDPISKGLAHVYMMDYKEAIKVFQSNNESTLLAYTYWQIAINYQEAKDYELALEHCLQAAQWLETINSPPLLSQVQMTAGLLYMELYEVQQAISFFENAVLNFEKNELIDYDYAAVLDHLAYLHRLQNNYHQALQYRLKSNRVWKELASYANLDKGKASLALIYQEGFGQTNKAIALLKEAIALQEKRNDAENLRHSYLHLGNCYFLIGAFQQAQAVLNKGWKINENLRLSDQVSTDYLLWMARTKNSLSQFEEAYEDMDKYIRWGDSVMTDKRSVEISKLESQHRIEQQQKEKEILAIRESLHAAELKKQQTAIFAIALFALLLFIGSIYFYRAYRQRKILSQQLAQKNEEVNRLYNSQSEWFTNIAHEIRTPLTLILGPLNTLNQEVEHGNDPSLKAEQISLAKRNTHGLLNLVNKILDFSKLNEQLLNLDQKPTDLVAMIRNHLSMYDTALKEKQIEVNINVAEQLIMNVDQEKIEKILSNLISNAIKYSRHGGSIKVELLPPLEDEAMVELKVEDNGIGISKEHLNKIFERHFRINSHTEVKGSGIGLAFAQELAKTHGGYLSVSSIFRRGSTFTLHLPTPLMTDFAQKEIQPSTIETESTTAEAPFIYAQGNQADCTLLLVEDHADMRSFVSSLFPEKFLLKTAIDGQDALEQLDRLDEDKLPDLIITDMMMPRIGGAALVDRLKKNQRYKNIPIIVLTARSKSKDKISALQMGVDDYVVKPFEASELLARVTNILENNRMRKQFILEEISEGIDQEPLAYHDKVVKELEEEVRKIMFESETGHIAISVVELAQLAKMEQRSLYRMLVKTTGLTPLKFLREIRLQESYEMLKHGQLTTVQEVAFHVGFEKPSHFSKLFSERYGIRPSQLLKTKTSFH